MLDHQPRSFLTGGRLNAARAVGTSSTTTRDSRGPPLTQMRPVRGSAVRDRTPKMAATVRDGLTELAKGDIRLYVDRRQRSPFLYNAATDRLTYKSGGLSEGRHAVRIIATDAAGNRGDEIWRFTVRS